MSYIIMSYINMRYIIMSYINMSYIIMSYINMSYIIPRTNSDDNNDSFVLEQHTELDYNASSLK